MVEGRDIGTQVFPDTPHKFFLNARSQVRYRRRYEQLREAGEAVGYDEVVEEIDSRDERDAGREASPLSLDDSYVEIDTSEVTAEEVAERMARRVLAVAGGEGCAGRPLSDRRTPAGPPGPQLDEAGRRRDRRPGRRSAAARPAPARV